MSNDLVPEIDKHINSKTVLANIKHAALIVDLGGVIARVNQRFAQVDNDICEGQRLQDRFSEQSVFGSVANVTKHALGMSGLHPCRIQSKHGGTENTFLAFFSLLRSRFTHKPVAILLQIDDRNARLAKSLVETQKLSQLHNSALRKLHSDGIHDPLSGLKNRRFMDSFLQMQCDLARRQLLNGALVIVDIDHFKRVNDTFGHQVGDQVIATVADTIRQRLRESDIACRWGGEEFAVFLHNAKEYEAISICEELRQRIYSRHITHNNHDLSVTASFGVALLSATDTPQALFSRADEALYVAKKQGRNQVSMAIQA
ncbi:MAG: GGDEF domain-containing protein [Alteromonadaceae bacterium]|nr:GGDEF domain-containing protein [Alteromonadaceae bacterium]